MKWYYNPFDPTSVALKQAYDTILSKKEYVDDQSKTARQYKSRLKEWEKSERVRKYYEHLNNSRKLERNMLQQVNSMQSAESKALHTHPKRKLENK